MWNWLSRDKKTFRSPLTPEEARTVRGFDHVRTWQCPCGACLRVRCREPREDGPSNFQVDRRSGHSLFPADQLTWAGLAEERGWIITPGVKCPACQHELTVGEYRQAVREGKLRRR